MSVRALQMCVRGVEKTRRYFSGRALILLYHRIAETDLDPWQLAVTPRHLEEHLQVLREYGSVIPLQKMAGAVQRSRLPRRCVAVTFDDGYADNLVTAKPLLEKYDVPATLFITSGYTGRDREFWWDELERLFLEPGELPGALDIKLNGNHKRWELGENAHYEEGSYQRNQLWRAWQSDEPTSRHSIYRSLWQLMLPMSENDRLRLRDELLSWAGDSGSARRTHRVLGREEIVELDRGGLIEVGCHTITHPQLSALGRKPQLDEIRQSKLSLEEIVGHPLSGFAYPYGRDCDYTGETVGLVREAGFAYSCTTSVGIVERGVDRFQLPRVQAQDIDGESLGRLLSEWL